MQPRSRRLSDSGGDETQPDPAWLSTEQAWLPAAARWLRPDARRFRTAPPWPRSSARVDPPRASRLCPALLWLHPAAMLVPRLRARAGLGTTPPSRRASCQHSVANLVSTRATWIQTVAACPHLHAHWLAQLPTLSPTRPPLPTSSRSCDPVCPFPPAAAHA